MSAVKQVLDTLERRTACLSGATPHKERVKIIEQFQAGKIDTLVCQPECFKYGIDLSAADTMIYMSTPAIETRIQTEDRMINLKRQRAVLIIDIIAKNTVEEAILKSIDEKESNRQCMRRVWKSLC